MALCCVIVYTYSMYFWKNGESIDLPSGKVVCVGRNYVEHVHELHSDMPTEPLLFIKPQTSIQQLGTNLQLSSHLGPIHYECELALLVGKTMKCVNPADSLSGIMAIGLALDLTLRELQYTLQENGHPWERCKAFDGSCPITPFIPLSDVSSLQDTHFKLFINDDCKQEGQPNLMIFGIADLLATMSQFFTLNPGDIVLTGTPKGVGPLKNNDKLVLQLGQDLTVTSTVSIAP